jgi:hypothetical protein
MRIGPSLAKVPLLKPFVNAFAMKAAPRVPTILFLLDITDDSKLLRAPARSPLSAVWTAEAAPVDCARLRAVPASIADILNDFLALLRGAFLRLATIEAGSSAAIYVYPYSWIVRNTRTKSLLTRA